VGRNDTRSQLYLPTVSIALDCRLRLRTRTSLLRVVWHTLLLLIASGVRGTLSGLEGLTSIGYKFGHLEWYHAGRFATFRSRSEHGRNLRAEPGTALGKTEILEVFERRTHQRPTESQFQAYEPHLHSSG
jgi:hypothetical protein